MSDDVACPTCGAEPGRRCRTLPKPGVGSVPTSPHRARTSHYVAWYWHRQLPLHEVTARHALAMVLAAFAGTTDPGELGIAPEDVDAR